MTDLKNSLKKGYWIIPVFIVFILWLMKSVRDDVPKYRDNGEVTLGRITQKNHSTSGMSIKYAYQVGATRYDKRTSLGMRQLKVGEYVYVIYLKDDPDKSILLVSKKVDLDKVFKGSVKDLGLTDQEIREAILGKKP